MAKTNWQTQFGVILIIISSVLFASLLVVPFLNISVERKLALTPIVVIAGEIMFWIGGVLVGKEMIVKYKKYLNPMQWIKREKKDQENDKEK